MAKTIEIASRHFGKMKVLVKGESVQIEFKDTGHGVGIALCDYDEAAVLLRVGMPDFWKPGIRESDYLEMPKEDSPETVIQLETDTGLFATSSVIEQAILQDEQSTKAASDIKRRFGRLKGA